MLLIWSDGTSDPRRYNAPTADKIGVLIMDGAVADHRDIVLRTRSNELQRISEMHQYYDSLHCVLMFPHGDIGWTINASSNGPKISTMDWYSHRLRVRNGRLLHVSGRLFQQYNVDMYAKMEHGCPRYLR